MKKLIISVMLVFIFTSLNAQTMDIEVGKMYQMNLKNGNTVKARITGVTETQVTCNLNDESYPATYERSDIICVEPVRYPSIGSIGVGIGVPYGVVGVNGELALMKYIAISAGFGSTIYAGNAYSFGGRAYFTPTGSKWRPRLSAHYGTNAVISVTGATEIAEKFEGLTIGAGLLGMFGDKRRTGFDFEVVYLASRGDFDNRWSQIKNSYTQVSGSEIGTGKIKIIIGYRIAF